MNPSVTDLSEEGNYLNFRLSGVNVSLANALRRIILSEIPCIVFRTAPYEQNLATFEINTTRMNNELLKQRLSCVPIHIDDVEFPYNDYIVEVDVKNDSESIQYVTTKDFKIKNIKNNKYLSNEETRKVFPADKLTGDYILFARLRPRISDEIDGEHLKFNCKLDVGFAKQNYSFNVVSTCSYSATQDIVKARDVWSSMEKKYKDEGMSEEVIEYKKADWYNLDAQRITVADSFDFLVESVGQFDNVSIVIKACDVMVRKINKFKDDIQSNFDLISKSKTTIRNSYVVKLIGEDYTLGKALEYVLYNDHYYNNNNPRSDKILTFCGFRKPHPHIDESIILIGFVNDVEVISIVELLRNSCDKLIKVFQDISSQLS